MWLPNQRNRMAAHIRRLASRSSIEPLKSFPGSIQSISKSTNCAMLRKEREVTESASLVSVNSAIWSCISRGALSKPMDTILRGELGFARRNGWVQSSCSSWARSTK